MMPRISDGDKIVIFRNGSIGNTLVAVPVIRSIKRKSPKCFLSVIVDPSGKQLFMHCPYIDELITYDKRGVHKPLISTVKFVRELRRKKFTKAILLKRFFRNEAIAYFSGIKGRFGFSTRGVKPFKLTATVPYIEGKNIIDLNNDILKLLDVEPSGVELELWFSREDEKDARDFITAKNIERYIVFHPGGQTIGRTGLSGNAYADLGKEIINRFGCDIVITDRPGEEKIVNGICSSIGENSYSAVGLPLLASAQLIKRARVLIGNDSGPSHIADAVRTPGIIFYPPSKDTSKSHINKWKPRGHEYIAIEVSGSEREMINQTLNQLGRLLK